jgi:aryl-alcohol dehydrogenase-like predicted oxidoreductase
MDEIVEAFSDVVRSGKALYWGTSEWSAVQIAEAHTYAKANGLVAPVTEQPQYSMLHRDRVEEQILPVTHPKGIGLVVWSPLAMGMLTGKYDDGIAEGSRFANLEQFKETFFTEDNVRRVKALKAVADDLGITRAQLALAWVLRQPGVSSVITGATKVSQIEDNMAAAEVELSEDHIAKIDEILAS